MALQRRVVAAATAGDGFAATDGAVSELFPTLVEFLTQQTWAPEEKRKTGTIMILAEHGVWKCWINDRDGKRSAWVSGGLVMDLLNSVERGLADDSLTWREDVGKKR